MLKDKLSFSQEVLDIVRNICETVFNMNNDAEISELFGIDKKQMEEAILAIVQSLPDRLFASGNPQILEEIKYIIAREYIFFQVQERDDPEYKNDLQNFIRIFSRDMLQRIREEGSTLQLKEE